MDERTSNDMASGKKRHLHEPSKEGGQDEDGCLVKKLSLRTQQGWATIKGYCAV